MIVTLLLAHCVKRYGVANLVFQFNYQEGGETIARGERPTPK